MDVLSQDLRMNYDPRERAMNLEGKLESDVHIRHVEVNEIKSTITIYGWIKWVWALTFCEIIAASCPFP